MRNVLAVDIVSWLVSVSESYLLIPEQNPGYFPGYKKTRFEKAGEKLYKHYAGTTEKCNFCMERIDAGMSKGLIPGIHREATPACVNACQARAVNFW
jgi:hypothetical protein